MSRFYGSLKGSAKTEATRRGTRWLEGHVRGWGTGIKVYAHGLNPRGEGDDGDKIIAQVTGGSDGSPHVSAEMVVLPDGTVEFYAHGNCVHTVTP